ncbi:haloalkanoic acid dehalogenase [Aaosphaeria arxii CBS 175.79]|uniref:Haloalkanoic acid dehalogenase n=1 Tax=Aaosphaeria arxii CBS 175.79 TaxID=1450172 RepID=A0A6A5XWD0_9PLEO|nr:haloalkanoic acid dehalogenase [Aaosphaeria arxii CBS 175.79]KAF2017635.1 haloalkanoic acid dehalogenase [Aaosphaeria arxii CBS 175.79]
MGSLTNYRLLCFDVYGTLIDWETGVVNGLQPLLQSNNRQDISKQQLLEIYHEFEHTQQAETPDMPYDKLLTAIHPKVASKLGFPTPPESQSKDFGDSVGTWPAFPDTVNALRRLSKHYKLVVLSNVDRESFSKSNTGPLQGTPFDLIITAQDVGSYKPDLANFDYMIKAVGERFGVAKDEIIQTAQSQFHDHHPAKAKGIKSSWIVRPGAVMGNRAEEIYDWKFDTLGDMADALERELAK